MSKLCRTCLHEIKGGNFVSLNDNLEFQRKLTFCFPTMNIHHTPEPVLCICCVIALNTAYEFTCKWLEVEEIIREANSGSLQKTENNINSNEAASLDSNMEDFPERYENSTNNHISLRECKVHLIPLEVTMKQKLHRAFGTNESIPLTQSCGVILTPTKLDFKTEPQKHDLKAYKLNN